MGKAKLDELDTGESLRCGRCASILPDETLSYCPACGALFSEVPPTTSYVTLESRYLKLFKRKRLFQLGAALCLALSFSFFALLSGLEVHRRNVASKIESNRKVVFWIKQLDEFPKLEEHLVQQGIPVGMQAFSDHFGFDVQNWEVRNNAWPESFDQLYTADPKAAQDSLFWKESVDQYFAPTWAEAPYAPLNVVITNHPIRADHRSDEVIETAHLGKNRLVSGLGHPSLVIVSLHRLLSEFKDLDEKGKKTYFGEYIVAHELGHALLGLKDYVEFPNQAIPLWRGPASASAGRQEYCMMHTDAGGGLKAWELAQSRTLGQESQCELYSPILELHQLRNSGIDLIKVGEVEKGRRLLQSAVSGMSKEVMKGNVNPTFLRLWENELRIHSSIFAALSR